ncbi:MAG: sigma-70 family RNA polymerase sigma factor [Kiritimatiellae bacterium]|nr:sigma-70 family RNA polymerase sigma factor [Kiritimatiellia bacterium]
MNSTVDDVQMTDDELLRQFVEEDSQTAFGTLVQRHHRMVYATCLRRLGGAVGLAEDATQAVFIVLARKARGLRNPKGLARWLFRTAGFVVGHVKREEARRRKREEEAAAMAELDRAAQAEVGWWTGSEGVVYQAISRLRAPYQAVVILHCLEGRPQKEVARQLGCSEAAVSKRVTRGLEQLRGLLARKGVGVTVAGVAAFLVGERAQAATAGLAASCEAAALGGLASGVAGAAAGLADAVTRTMLWMKVKMAAAVVCSSVAVAAGGTVLFRAGLPDARVVGTVKGFDFSLPVSVRMTPYAGYIGGEAAWRAAHAAEPHMRDGNLHFAVQVKGAWKDLNPAEGVYDWARLDGQIERATSDPGTGFALWLYTYATTGYHTRARRDAPDPEIPAWVVEKEQPTLLANGVVAAWAPDCRVQEHLGRFLKALGARYKDQPKLIGVCVNGFCVPNDSLRLGVSEELLREAEARAGLTQQTWRMWAYRFVRDWMEAFQGQEGKLMWATGGGAPMPGWQYMSVSDELWQSVYRQGAGGIVLFSGDWQSRLDPSHGMDVDGAGYIVFDDTFAPVRLGRAWVGENEGGYPNRQVRYGSTERERFHWFMSNLWVLQSRCNWMTVPDRRTAQIMGDNPSFARWVDLSLGKTARTSADAWCLLRESYMAGRKGSTRTVKNFSRWLMQRDVAPDGRTVPAERVDVSEYGQWARNRDYEFHARRTDVTGGSPFMYFRIDRAFGADPAPSMHLKITYLDGPATAWDVQYSSAGRILRSESVETTGSGGWKTVTFRMPDMRFDARFAGSMDFRIRVLGESDLTVKMVRVVAGASGAGSGNGPEA